MASAVTAAPTDGAPPFALHELDKCFGATHGKGLGYGSRLFILDEPTVGVDIGAKAKDATQETILTEAIGV